MSRAAIGTWAHGRESSAANSAGWFCLIVILSFAVDRIAVARVFVSHASGDRMPADVVHRWLVGDGHEVFLDQEPCDGIAVGEQWERRLHERLRWADAVVCVVTSAYVASVWCAAEVATAVCRGVAGCCRCAPSWVRLTRCWSLFSMPR
jgi:hypothetical protein